MELEILFELAVIMVGAAVLGTLFLCLRQPIVIAYIAIGFALGPGGLGLIKETTHLEQIAHVGVILLLFLIGLNLQPQKLLAIFQKTALLTMSTSLLFALVATTFALLLQFSLSSSLLIGAAMMFSSTVVGLKLVPTTTLHHKRTGEVMTGVLLLQDLLAILLILLLSGGGSEHPIIEFGLLLLKFIALGIALFFGVRGVVLPLLTRFDVVQEYTFVATLGWCLLGAEAAHILGLSYEIGAFTAGISIASSPVARAIAEHLKPLREFFLILFFFAIGARLNLQIDPLLLTAAVIFGILLVPLKAIIFRKAFEWSGEKPSASKELSVRLSQASEFSLLVLLAATKGGWLHEQQGMMIQITTLITFIFSTYWTVLHYPTPISASRNLLQD